MPFVKPALLAFNGIQENINTSQDNSNTDRTVVQNCLDWFDFSFFTLQPNNFIEGDLANDMFVNSIGIYVVDQNSNATFTIAVDGNDIFTGTFGPNQTNKGLTIFEFKGAQYTAGQTIRFTLNSAGGTPNQIQIRSLAIGTLFRPPFGQSDNKTRIAFEGGATFTNSESINGSFIGRDVVRNVVSDQVIFDYLTEDQLIDEWQPLAIEMTNHAFFYAWDTEEHPNEVAFCTASQLPKPQNMQYKGKRTITVDMNCITEEYQS